MVILNKEQRKALRTVLTDGWLSEELITLYSDSPVLTPYKEIIEAITKYPLKEGTTNCIKLPGSVRVDCDYLKTLFLNEIKPYESN